MSNMESYIGGIVDAEQRGEIEYFANGAKVPFSIGDVPGLVKPNKRHPMRFVFDDAFSSLTSPYSLSGGLRRPNSRSLNEEAYTFLGFLAEKVGEYKVLIMGPGFGRECYEAGVTSVEIDTISRTPFNPNVAVPDGGLAGVSRVLTGKLVELREQGIQSEIRKMIELALSTSFFDPELLFKISREIPSLGLMRMLDKPFVRRQMIANMPEPSIDLPKDEYMFAYENLGVLSYVHGKKLVAVLQRVLSSLHEDGIIYYCGMHSVGEEFVVAMKRVAKGKGKKYQITYLSDGVLVTRVGHPVLNETDSSDMEFGRHFKIIV